MTALNERAAKHLASPRRSLQSQASALALQASRIATPACLAVTASNGKWTLARHLLEIDRAVVRFIRENRAGTAKERILLIDAPPRHGKALQVDTPIPTPCGWKRIRDLRPGDSVFGPDGIPCAVVAVTPTWRNRPVFTVTTDDGDQIVADAEHEWVVRLDRKSKAVTTRTTKFLASRTSSRNPMVKAQASLQLPEVDLPIDPYVLGVWLGDGNTVEARFTSADAEIINELDQLEGPVRALTTRDGTSSFGLGPNLRDGCGWANTLKFKLRMLGVLGNKHIPQIYLWASESQRRSLLQGLIDTDGYVAKDGQIEFCTTLETLAYQAKELVASLGHKASVIHGRATLYGKDCGPKYRVMFYMPDAARLPRKRKRCRCGERAFKRYITVMRAGRGDTCCIQVDHPTGMFLCGRSMLPTHNSEYVSHYLPAWHMGTFPDDSVIICSYESSFAAEWGAKARDTFYYTPDPTQPETIADLFNVIIDPHNKSASRWGFWDREGVCRALGAGGPVTGRGADLLIIDDPCKNQEEALSPVIRESTWNWFTSTALTRLSPHGSAIIIQTRWHRDDLGGRLLNRATTLDGEPVKHIHLPALPEAPGVDPTPDFLNRAEGEPLWPERWSLRSLQRIRQGQPLFWWTAMYQGRPTSADQMEWPDSYFDPDVIWCDALPDRGQFVKVILYIDPSKGKRDRAGDYSAIVIILIHENNLIYVDSSIERRPVSKIVTDTVRLCNYHKPDMVGCEGNAFQELIGPELERQTRNTFGLRWPIFMDFRTSKDNKLNFIRSLEPYLREREFRFLHTPDNELLISQLRDFPIAPFDDGPDALAGAINLPLRVGGVEVPEVVDRYRQPAPY